MKDYYKILGIDELTSKPLVKIAYATAMDYCLTNNLSPEKIKDINEAYFILRSYRLRLRYNNMRSTGKADKKIQNIIDMIVSKPESCNSKLIKTASRLTLEIKYIIRSLIFETCVFLLYVISSTLGDILMIVSSGVSFISSLIFYFGVINLWLVFIPRIYSVILILLSVGILIWFLYVSRKKVIKTLSN